MQVMFSSFTPTRFAGFGDDEDNVVVRPAGAWPTSPSGPANDGDQGEDTFGDPASLGGFGAPAQPAPPSGGFGVTQPPVTPPPARPAAPPVGQPPVGPTASRPPVAGAGSPPPQKWGDSSGDRPNARELANRVLERVKDSSSSERGIAAATTAEVGAVTLAETTEGFVPSIAALGLVVAGVIAAVRAGRRRERGE